MKYFISMGSNEGPSEEIMGAALHKLSLMPLLSIGKVSSLYKTPPWGKTDQAEFLNAVIEADWQDTPEGLLELLLDTEKAFGRRRMMRWGPRTLDLDLLYGENVEKQTEFLKLPHPFYGSGFLCLFLLRKSCLVLSLKDRIYKAGSGNLAEIRKS